jgi:hypothetical protein
MQDSMKYYDKPCAMNSDKKLGPIFKKICFANRWMWYNIVDPNPKKILRTQHYLKYRIL